MRNYEISVHASKRLGHPFDWVYPCVAQVDKLRMAAQPAVARALVEFP